MNPGVLRQCFGATQLPFQSSWPVCRPHIFRALSCLVLYSLWYYASFDAQLCARTMTMEDAYQVKITLESRAPNVDANSLT